MKRRAPGVPANPSAEPDLLAAMSPELRDAFREWAETGGGDPNWWARLALLIGVQSVVSASRGLVPIYLPVAVAERLILELERKP